MPMLVQPSSQLQIPPQLQPVVQLRALPPQKHQEACGAAAANDNTKHATSAPQLRPQDVHQPWDSGTQVKETVEQSEEPPQAVSCNATPAVVQHYYLPQHDPKEEANTAPEQEQQQQPQPLQQQQQLQQQQPWMEQQQSQLQQHWQRATQSQQQEEEDSSSIVTSGVVEHVLGGALSVAILDLPPPPGLDRATQEFPLSISACNTTVPTCFGPEDLKTIRRQGNLCKSKLHKSARQCLNEFYRAHADYTGPKSLDTLFDWRAYLAAHDQGEELVRPGIVRAVIDRFEPIPDPNRRGLARRDFILHRADGTAYRVHPGSNPRNDAKPVFCRKHSYNGIYCFGLEDADRIPEGDRLAKKEAFDILQDSKRELQWWKLAANLGAHTSHVIGVGLVSALLVHCDRTHAILRFHRLDYTSVDLYFTSNEGKGVRTRVCETQWFGG